MSNILINVDECLRLISDKYNDYISDEQYVFKSCEIEWIVVLKECTTTTTNEDRDDVIDEDYAYFRGNTFFVEKILNKFDINKTTDSIFSTRHMYDKYAPIEYTVGKIVSVGTTTQKHTINIVDTHGIHFFKTLKAAFYYELFNGGLPMYFKVSTLTGLIKKYDQHGSLIKTREYDQINKIKTYVDYYPKSRKNATSEIRSIESFKIDDPSDYSNHWLPHGCWLNYNANGILLQAGNYENGKKIGTWKTYYASKIIQSEMTYNYNNNNENILATYYDESGNMRVVGKYVNEMKHGSWKFYDEKKKLLLEDVYENNTLVKEINHSKWFFKTKHIVNK